MSTSRRDIRILIADDHNLFREGLRCLLEGEEGYRVVGEAGDGRETLRLLEREKPDVLLLDLEMPNLNGFDVLNSLRSSAEKPRVIVLAADIAKDQAVEVFKLGAQGLILKESAASMLYQCINAVVGGKYWVFREAMTNLSKFELGADHIDKTRARSKTFGLTSREMEVLATVVAGKSNREIAEQLSISEQTVKHHVTNIFDKAGVYNRLELALFAIHHDLIHKSDQP